MEPSEEVIGMEIIPWKAFGGEVSSFRREMDRLWDEFFGQRPLSEPFLDGWNPSVDITETKDSFVVKAELPGLEAADVDVSLSGDLLIIKGEKKKEAEDKDEHRYCAERYYGTFQRVFRLPTDVKDEGIEATFDKGILKVTLPKKEEAKKKEIKIKAK